MKKIYSLIVAIAILVANYISPILVLAQTVHEISVDDVDDPLTEITLVQEIEEAKEKIINEQIEEVITDEKLQYLEGQKIDSVNLRLNDNSPRNQNEVVHNSIVYSLSGNTATVVGYEGTGGHITILGHLTLTVEGENHSYNVTSIAADVFNNRNITSASIGASAFGAMIIGDRAFANNPMTSLEINNANIGVEAFQNNKLTSLTIRAGVTIGQRAFQNNELTSLTLNSSSSGSSTTIRDGAFADNKLTSLTLGRAVVGARAFMNNELEHLSFTEEFTVNEIGVEAFMNNKLTQVMIPSSIIFLQDRAFANNQLQSVQFLGNTQSNIHSEIFIGNPSLEIIQVPVGNATAVGNRLRNGNSLDDTPGSPLLVEGQRETTYSSATQLVQTVNYGSQIRFEVASDIKYQWTGSDWHEVVIDWYKDGELLENQTGSILTLPMVRLRDSGLYHAKEKGTEVLTTLEDIYLDVELPKIEVEVNPQQFFLGTDVTSLDPKVWFSVRLNDLELSEEDYEIELINEIDTSLVGNRTLRAKVTYEEFSEEASIPVQVIWGSTINISGAWWYVDQEFRSVAAYTLHPGQGITFVPGRGGESLTLPSLPQAYEDVFSRFSVLSGRETIVIEETEPDFEFKTIRSHTPTELAEQFDRHSGGSPVPVAEGDVVESWHVFQNHREYVEEDLDKRLWNVLIKDEERLDVSAGLNTVYYEVMEDHFRPLVINQGSAIKTRISHRTSNKELEQRIDEFIDLPTGVTPLRFTEYPNRSTRGETRGVILVQERLASGNTIQMHYEIPFEVDGFLSLNIPENIQFKTTSIQSGETIIPRKDEQWSLSIEDSRLEREPWELVVSADPLIAVDNDHRLDHALVFKKGDRTDFLSQGSATVHRETLGSRIKEISWNTDEGLLLEMDPIEARATTYTTTLYWTLRNVRPNVLDD